jgi:hypothetical protein
MVALSYWRIRIILAMLALAWLWGCAASQPEAPTVEMALQASESFTEDDSRLAEWIKLNQPDSAMALANQLTASGKRSSKIIGTYWRAVSLLQMGHADSAKALFEFYRGKWSPNWREASAESFLKLLRERSARAAAVQPCATAGSPGKMDGHRLEALEAENAALHSEVDRLKADNSRFEKLLRELDKLP